MNSEGTSLAPINLKVKSCDSTLERDETIFAKPDIATHLKEMEQVVIWLIGNSMYMYKQDFALYMSYTMPLYTCCRESLKKNMMS